MMNDVDVTLFQENGYLVVRQLFTPEEMEEAKQAAKALVENKGRSVRGVCLESRCDTRGV